MRERIPEATVARLPVYLRCLVDMSERGTHRVSSDQLADAAGVNSAKVRKDLSYLGSYGTRGVGYDVEYLRYQIAREIGVTEDLPVVIVGIGNLGHALANYDGFSSRGFRIVGLVDSDPRRLGERVGPMRIRGLDELEAVVREESVAIGVLAVFVGYEAYRAARTGSGALWAAAALDLVLAVLVVREYRRLTAARPRPAGSRRRPRRGTS